jgi:hypothetical protein
MVWMTVAENAPPGEAPSSRATLERASARGFKKPSVTLKEYPPL